jgi:NhaP-type Na+/H+ or K+/H+ antiporter
MTPTAQASFAVESLTSDQEPAFQRVFFCPLNRLKAISRKGNKLATSIAIIIVLGLLADYIFRRFRLPGLVGMLIAGIVCGPCVLDLMAPEMMAVSADFRRIALIVILLRAGFELHRDTLRQVGRAAILMSCVPALFEIAGVMLVAPRLLGISTLEAALLGAILGAVSPAVVVPLMIDFMDRGRGAKKGIPTLVLASSSIDDVFVIVLFSIFLGMTGQEQVNLWAKLGEIPVSISLGIIVGLIPGYLLYRLFKRYDWRSPKRTILVMGVAILLSWIEKETEKWVPVASLLGVMTIGFIILDKSEAIAHIISQKLKKLWIFAELLLFVLVGAQVNIRVAWNAGLAGMLVIVTGLVFRSIGTYISLIKTPFTVKEKLFCVVAYIPKATVQAAIGALPMTAGVPGGEVILAVAVLSILLTAPLGAIGITIFGEKVLDHGERGAYRFKELREKMHLPIPGERVCSRRFGTIWKVIEQKEIWLDSPGKEATDKIPAIYLRYWKEDTAHGPGTGKTKGYRYSQMDPSFEEHWEILYDW